MAKYPIFLEMAGNKAVIIGGGQVAYRKAESLLSAGSKLTIIAETICDDIKKLCQTANAILIEAEYDEKYLSDSILVIAATDDMPLNKKVYEYCRSRRILCNIVDVPELCDFYIPSVVKRGALQIAISTDGGCPAYARKLRENLSEIITDNHGRFLDELDKIRKQIISQVADIVKRKKILTELAGDKSFEIFEQKGSADWQKYALVKIKDLG